MDGLMSDNQTLPPSDLGVSRRALAFARTVDRLPPGEYVVRLEKRTVSDGAGWKVELAQSTTVKVMELAK